MPMDQIKYTVTIRCGDDTHTFSKTYPVNTVNLLGPFVLSNPKARAQLQKGELNTGTIDFTQRELFEKYRDLYRKDEWDEKTNT